MVQRYFAMANRSRRKEVGNEVSTVMASKTNSLGVWPSAQKIFSFATAQIRNKTPFGVAVCCWVTIFPISAIGASAQFDPLTLVPVRAAQTTTGLHASIGDETLDATICADGVVHVVTQAHADKNLHSPKPWLLPANQSCPGAKFTFSQDEKLSMLTTSKMKVTLDMKRGISSS